MNLPYDTPAVSGTQGRRRAKFYARRRFSGVAQGCSVDGHPQEWGPGPRRSTSGVAASPSTSPKTSGSRAQRTGKPCYYPDHEIVSVMLSRVTNPAQIPTRFLAALRMTRPTALALGRKPFDEDH